MILDDTVRDTRGLARAFAGEILEPELTTEVVSHYLLHYLLLVVVLLISGSFLIGHVFCSAYRPLKHDCCGSIPHFYHVLPRFYLRNDKGESVVGDLLGFGDGFGHSM